MRLLGADEADCAARGLLDHALEDGLEVGMGVAKGDTDPVVPPLVATANGLGEDFRRSRSNWYGEATPTTGAGAPIRGLFRVLTVSIL